MRPGRGKSGEVSKSFAAGVVPLGTRGKFIINKMLTLLLSDANGSFKTLAAEQRQKTCVS